MEKSWSSADMKSNAEFEIYDYPTDSKPEIFNDTESKDYNEGLINYENYWRRLARGVRSIWATKHTEDIESNRDLYIKTTLRELVIYIVFLVILMIISFGMTTGQMYWFTHVLNTLFLNGQANNNTMTFATMGADADFWTFMTGPLLSGLYWNSWYNNLNVDPSELNFIYYENKLIGLPRIRQLRMDNNTCIIPNEFQNYVTQCYGSYNSPYESTQSYGLQNSTAWTYTSPSVLNSMPFQGSVGTYGGGGFYLDLAADSQTTLNMLNMLYNNLWVDRGTRAVIIDFTVYNTNINLFCVIKLVAEFPAVGGVIPTYDFRTVKLIRYVSPLDYFVLVCELIFLVFIIYYLVEECIEIRKHKTKYFNSVWNVLDIIVVLISIVCIIFNIYRTIAVQNILSGLLANANQHPNFDYLSYYQIIYNYLIAITVFLAWVKIFKYISFNKTMTQLSSTLGRCSRDLVGFAVMFFIIFFAFAQLGYLLFGPQLADFAQLQYSVFTLYRIILGDFTFAEYLQVHPILGPLYFILYVFFVFFVLFNMFLAIINDTYSEVKEELANQKNEFEIGDYFKERTQMILEKLNIKKEKLIGLQNAMLFGDTNNDGKMDFDEWKTELKKRGYADEEIEAVFAKYDIDGDRVLDEVEQIAMAKELEEQKFSLNKEILVEQEEGLNHNLGLSKNMVHGISNEEYYLLDSRVEKTESHIGTLLSKIDQVLYTLDKMEKTKSKRRKAMGTILNTLTSNENLNNEERKLKLEVLVQEEIAKLNNDSVITHRSKPHNKFPN